MGKCGPCRHCGVTSTPLWRNGPPDKPVLCNACGSRWRTKGSLANYTPLHVREAFDSEDLKVSKAKNISTKSKEQKFYQKKQINGALESEYELQYCDQNFRKVVKGDPSNRSSAGSVISYSESCACFGTTDASDITGPAQSNVWDSLVPSKKRTFITRPKPSPVEKLTKELYSILHEQQSSNLSSSEGDLLYESGTPLGSSEIGYGGLLIRNPNSKLFEESEASSFPVDNKSYIIGEVYSGSAFFPVNSENKGTSLTHTGACKLKKSAAEEAQENAKRDKSFHEILRLLQDRNSPLSSVDLNNIINYEGFLKYLNDEEQHRLMKYLPFIDTSKPPESLKTMFKSRQYFETVSYFQQLLQEGIFDLSFSGANIEDCKILTTNMLLDVRKPEWMELIKQETNQQIKIGKRIPTTPNSAGGTKLVSPKRPHNIRKNNPSELKGLMRSPKRICKSGASNLPSICKAELITSDAGSKLTDETDGNHDNEGTCFSPRSLFASSPDTTAMLAPLLLTGDSSDHDVLLHVPHSGSFPEAELLCLPCKEKTVPNGSPEESGVFEGEESLSNFPSSSYTNRQEIRR